MGLLPVLLLLAALFAPATPQFDVSRPGIDVLRYTFNLTLSDRSNVIEGDARVTVRFTEGPRDFYLDLVSRHSDDTGMTVAEVSMDGKPVHFDHKQNRLWIHPGDDPVDSVETFGIVYRGVPADGLVISKNLYGDRTFFADNWPYRARHWIPTVDVPSDKALVDFIVTAPDHYQVISNGRLVEETDVAPGLRLTHWSTTEAIPTKIMVIGVARFAVQYLGDVGGIPVETWVYPQARKAGFYDFAVAGPILKYYTQVIGPYPFAKLANVQSTTRYGGMENASAIFYDERAVRGAGALESIVAHEVAHQWFGDSATEDDFHDVWLSEGFATFMDYLYSEHSYGPARLADRLAADRLRIIAYATANPTSSVVDTTIADPNLVLSTNSYEKGGWTLQMLRVLLGDETFFDALRSYYEQYRYGNATTRDFEKVVESVSGKDLRWFFDQWIYRPGVPDISVRSRYDANGRQVVLDVEQKQKLTYRLQLEVEIAAGQQESTETVELTQRRQTIRIKVAGKPDSVRLDPNVKILAHIATG